MSIKAKPSGLLAFQVFAEGFSGETICCHYFKTENVGACTIIPMDVTNMNRSLHYLAIAHFNVSDMCSPNTFHTFLYTTIDSTVEQVSMSLP